MSEEIQAGDKVIYQPSSKSECFVIGFVQEVIANQNGEAGYHILAPLPDDPTRVVRVWSNRGTITLTGERLT